MRIDFLAQGDLPAVVGRASAAIQAAALVATDKAAQETKAFARVQMRTALGDRAANTIGVKQFADTGASGLYDRWFRDGQDVPYAFSVGATVSPRNGRFLAVPSPALLAGELPTDVFQPGDLPSLGRLPLPSTGGPGARVARLTPKSLEYKLGVRLKYVPPGRGRRFGMLVIDNARVSPKGQVRGSRRKTPRYTFVAFFLLPQTRIPQQLDWTPVPGFALDRLEADFGEALDAAGLGD